MDEYKLLRILSYDKNNNIEEELKLRKNRYNSIFTDLYINPFARGESLSNVEYELFCNPIAKLRTISEEILDNSIKINEIEKKIPDVAKEAIINKLIVNEVQSTNSIEGVKSTKKELRDTLKNVKQGKESQFSRIIETYLGIIKSKDIYIEKIEDIRKIYDNLFMDSDNIDEYVEGNLFRKESAYIYKNNEKIHSGTKASDINYKMDKLVKLMNRKDIPFLIKPAICHYIIEYIHPFYDGNGRFGRYILSAYLKRKLDLYSALSISYSVNQNKAKYEKLFLDVANKNNYGELTHFVIGILELIKEGQKSIIELFEISFLKLKHISSMINSMIEDKEINEKESNILFLYAQIYAFNEHELLADNRIIDYYSKKGYKKSEVKNIIENFEDKEILTLKKKKPKIHELSNHMKINFE